MASSDLLDGLSGRIKQRVEEAVDPRETIRAVVKGREKEALVLTDHRIIIAKGSMLLGGHDSLLLSDVARLTSGLSALNIQLRSGQSYEFSFWPRGGNINAATTFVQLFRSAQLSDAAPASNATDTPLISVADEIKKLAELRNEGVLTEEEFNQQKAGLLERSGG